MDENQVKTISSIMVSLEEIQSQLSEGYSLEVDNSNADILTARTRIFEALHSLDLFIQN